MKVLHVIPAVAPRYGGPSQAVVKLGRALQAVGADVIVATTDADGPNRLQVAEDRLVDFHGVPTRFFRRQWSEAFKYSAPLATWLDNHVADFEVVHVHAVFSHASIAAGVACRRRSVPYLVRPLGTLDPWSLRQKAGRKQVMWHLGAKQLLRGAAAIHYTTDDERTLVEQTLGLTRGVVLPLGVDERYFQLTPDDPSQDSDAYVLALSRLHPKKNTEALIDAFVRLTHSDDKLDVRLVIAGDGESEYVETLRRRAMAANGRIEFRGWVSGDEKLRLLRGAALFVSPSFQENFGIAVAEAMACGVPVLVSPQVNLAPHIHAAGAGWVVEPRAESIAEAVVYAISNPTAASACGEAARNYARSSFSWPRIAVDLISLYMSLAGTDARRG